MECLNFTLVSFDSFGPILIWPQSASLCVLHLKLPLFHSRLADFVVFVVSFGFAAAALTHSAHFPAKLTVHVFCVGNSEGGENQAAGST